MTSAPVLARVLAADLEVSERTIYRDIVTLQAIGAPIKGEAGIGYRLEPDFFLPPLKFDAEEMDAIRLGLTLAAARAEGPISAAAERAAGKIAAVIDPKDRAGFLEAPFRAVSRAARESPVGWSGTLASLFEKVRSRAVLSIAYEDLSGGRSERVCRPLGLTAFDGTWLLTIWCEMRQDFRNLRVDRIQGVEDTGGRFRPERGRRFEDYLRSLRKPE